MINIIAAFIASIHIYVFILESLSWGKPAVNKTFRVKPEEVETIRSWAFNQGFYNLFLAAAIVTGFILMYFNKEDSGRTLVDYAVCSVFAAGAVLFFSAPQLRLSALIQALPATLYIILRLFLF